MIRYQSEYSNQVHQLVVSVSRHFWRTKSGEFKHQKKPFEVSLASLGKSEKNHLVHYLISDHFSGLFYMEIAVAPTLPSVTDFLLRAWSRKDMLPFCGLPEMLTVPKTVSDQFPDLLPWLAQNSVEVLPATSGFQAGVRDLRTWEQHLRYELAVNQPSTQAGLDQVTKHLCLELGSNDLFGTAKTERWHAGLGTLRFPLTESKSTC